MIDVHCHLTDSRYQQAGIKRIIERAKIRGVEAIITAGTSVESSQMAVKLAEKYDVVWATVGIHPEESYESGVVSYEIMQKLQQLTNNEKVVGIGETGLDYRMDTTDEEKKKQKDLFQKHIDLAREADLPLVIHNRNADEDILKMLNEYRNLKILMHCFTRNLEFMQKMATLGAYFSFGGMITYENNLRMRNVAKIVPGKFLLLETDAPYSLPEPLKSGLNEPANVKIVAEQVAKIRGMAIQGVDELTSANAKRLFKLI